jgi:hypothetical protein
VKLVSKFGAQNGCSAHDTLAEPKYAVDAILLGGQTIDILGPGETPQWLLVPGNPELASEPFDPSGAVPVPEPAGLSERVSALENLTTHLMGTLSALGVRLSAVEGSVLEQGRRLSMTEDRLRSLESRPIYTSCKAAINTGMFKIPLSCELR